MSKPNDEITEFINGLKHAKHIYAECPSCQHIFSLHSARLAYGKAPPKDFLSDAQKQATKALAELQALEEENELLDEEWREKLSTTVEEWRNKLALDYERWHASESTLKEKLRHMKSDVYAAQKDIVDEKVDTALRSQRGVIQGHIAELFPLFRKTRINPADMCALIPTKPLDFIVFEGLFQKEVTKIVFIDVKSGMAQLNPVQRSIRDAINDGNVEFKKLRIDFGKIKGTATEEPTYGRAYAKSVKFDSKQTKLR